MQLIDYLTIFRSRWRVMMAGIVFGLLVGVLFYAFSPRTYRAESILYISAQIGGGTSQSAYESSLLSEQRVTAYAELLTSDRVAGQVAQQLGLAESPQDIASKLSAQTQPDSVVLTIAAVDSSPGQSSNIANSAAEALSQLVSEVERPVASNGPPAVAARIVQPAVVPLRPVAPSASLSLAGGLLLGLVMGFGGAVLRHRTDNSIPSIEVLQSIIDAPALGQVLADDRVGSKPLIVVDEPASNFAERVKAIRANLSFLSMANDRRATVFTSALESEGKSTLVANFASTFAQAGSRVIVVDADLRRPRIASIFDVQDDVGLTNVLIGQIPLQSSVQRSRTSGLHLLVAGSIPPNPNELLASEQMTELMKDLRRTYDLILIDSAPIGLVSDGVVLAGQADGAVLVVAQSRANQRDAIAASKALEAVGADVLGSVLTMSKERTRSSQYGSYGGNGTSGQVPNDTTVTLSSSAFPSSAKRPTPRPR